MNIVFLVCRGTNQTLAQHGYLDKCAISNNVVHYDRFYDEMWVYDFTDYLADAIGNHGIPIQHHNKKRRGKWEMWTKWRWQGSMRDSQTAGNRKQEEEKRGRTWRNSSQANNCCSHRVLCSFQRTIMQLHVLNSNYVVIMSFDLFIERNHSHHHWQQLRRICVIPARLFAGNGKRRMERFAVHIAYSVIRWYAQDYLMRCQHLLPHSSFERQ